jgi:DNA-binding CsgD family transcriptional regulator
VALDSSASDQLIQAKLAEDQVSQRQPFVGREQELRQLQSAFATAAKGDGALILLVGEPGIGKTALSDQLCRFVSASGGLPVVGHCYDEGSFRPPYQPFVEVFATYLLGLDPDALQAELGSSAADLARIVPTLRERLHVSPPPPGDPEEDRWRLLQAATDLLRNAAAKQPLVVVLEDLHDADRGTLDLLLYIARNLHGTRILVVGTYRDVEVDRAHPLSAALTELHRASNVARVQLHGLSVDEVQSLLAETSRQTVPQPFAELVQRQTEGNPLFVRETLRFVMDTGLVEQRDGALRRVGDQTLAGRIPEGLRDAVGKRLSRLSGSTNRVLSVASVLGREFQLNVLSRVLAGPEEELEAALQEASAAAIIEERSVVGTTITYRFTHAFFRQTLYDEIVAPRRIRLHQQVAQALEEVHRGRLEEHAAELADHYAFSSDTSDLAKAVHYGQLAAKRATEVFAYGVAAAYLERALVVQDLVDSGDVPMRCDLLLALGEALFPSGDTERVVNEVAPDALVLAKRLGDRDRAFHACRLAIDCLDALGAATPAGTAQPVYLQWAEQARGYSDPDTVERIEANLALASAWATQFRWHETRTLRLEALALSLRLSDPEARFRSAAPLMYIGAPQLLDERLRLAVESTGWPREGVSSRNLGLVLCYAGWQHLIQGQRVRAEELWRQVEELAERTHVATVSVCAAQPGPALAIIDGHLEEALALSRGFVERADALGASARARLFAANMLLPPALYLGRPHAWLEAVEEYALVASPAQRSIALACLGRLDEARALVGPAPGRIAAADEPPMSALAYSLQAAIALRDQEAARVLGGRLAVVSHLSIGDWFYTCVARHLGDASVLVGDRAAAHAYYVQALEAAGKIRFRPELALTHVSLAELLLRGKENETARSDALEHLDTAIPELRDMKMQPALERAVALKAELLAATSRAHESASNVLTAREREITRLMADGLSNRDIAEKLVISEGTVDVHVKHILGKLGFRSRTQVAGWIARQGAG